MTTLIFDIETNGFLDKSDVIHSLVIKDLDTGEIYSCTNNFYVPKNDKLKLWTIRDGVELLSKADLIVGHNIIKFDIPVIRKIYPDFRYKRCFDTLIASKLAFPDIQSVDFRYRKRYKIPDYLKKKTYSLGAWGYRLGILKGTYCEEENAFEKWTPEMQVYCENDVTVNEALYKSLTEPKNPKRYINPDALETEQEFTKIIQMQEARGVKFNKDKAINLLVKLKTRKDEITPELKKYFKDKIQKTVFIPKRDNKTLGYVKGQPFIKRKLIKFNPNSKEMVKEQLLKFYDWTPAEFTEKGTPKLDTKAMSEMCDNIEKYPFAPLLEEYYIITKLLGQLSEGDKAWLNLVTSDNVIYGSVNCQGTVTYRCTHTNPNLAQIPAVGKPFGEECRELFEARKGYKLVGVDAKGLELRCLAHFMDDEEYTDLILNGDIHTFNQNILKEAAPEITRSTAKTWIYGFLYGAGNELLGEKVGKGKEIGKQMKDVFLNKIPKLAKLIKKVNEYAKQGFMYGIDDRLIPVTSKHIALNYLLQSTGAVVMKKALCILYEKLNSLCWVYGRDYAFVLNVHDEIQAEVLPEFVETYSQLAVKSIQEAGEYYGFNCPLDGDAKVGDNWRDTH